MTSSASQKLHLLGVVLLPAISLITACGPASHEEDAEGEKQARDESSTRVSNTDTQADPAEGIATSSPPAPPVSATDSEGETSPGKSPSGPDIDSLATQEPETQTTAASVEEMLKERLANYCDSGAISCFMMDSIQESKIVDLGRLGLDLNAETSTIVATEVEHYPFRSALQLEKEPSPKTDKKVVLPEGGILGFDVWIKPNAPTDTTWNAVGLEGFLSLRKIKAGYIECTYKVGLSGTFETIPKQASHSVNFEFQENQFAHIGCAFNGNNVSMWINGIEHIGPQHRRLLLPESSSYLLNWNSVFESPFTGQLGPMRVWHDIDLMASEIRLLHLLLQSAP